MIKEARPGLEARKSLSLLHDAAQTKRIPEYAQLGASMAFLEEEVLPEAAEMIRTMDEQMHYYIMSTSCDAGKLAGELS